VCFRISANQRISFGDVQSIDESGCYWIAGAHSRWLAYGRDMAMAIKPGGCRQAAKA
jgi:hypothetical protein